MECASEEIKEYTSWREDLTDIDINDNSLSLLIIGVDKNSAYECAQKLFGDRLEKEKDIWKITIDSYDIYAYTRWPTCKVYDKPKSNIYGFYLVNESKNYHDFKKIKILASNSPGIPKENKFIKILNEPGIDLPGSKLRFTIEKEEISNEILHNMINFQKKIVEKFNQIDINKNGTIDSNEVLKLLDMPLDTPKEVADDYLEKVSEKEVNFPNYRNLLLTMNDDFDNKILKLD